MPVPLESGIYVPAAVACDLRAVWTLPTQVILSTNKLASMIRKVTFHLHVRSFRVDYASLGVA